MWYTISYDNVGDVLFENVIHRLHKPVFTNVFSHDVPDLPLPEIMLHTISCAPSCEKSYDVLFGNVFRTLRKDKVSLQYVFTWRSRVLVCLPLKYVTISCAPTCEKSGDVLFGNVFHTLRKGKVSLQYVFSRDARGPPSNEICARKNCMDIFALFSWFFFLAPPNFLQLEYDILELKFLENRDTEGFSYFHAGGDFCCLLIALQTVWA